MLEEIAYNASVQYNEMRGTVAADCSDTSSFPRLKDLLGEDAVVDSIATRVVAISITAGHEGIFPGDESAADVAFLDVHAISEQGTLAEIAERHDGELPVVTYKRELTHEELGTLLYKNFKRFDLVLRGQGLDDSSIKIISTDFEPEDQ